MTNEMDDIFFAIEALERATEIINENMSGWRITELVKSNRITIERARQAYKNIMPKSDQPRVVYSDEPLTSCGCGNPGAKPPCSFCCPN
jgi:hypothetical protein